MVAIFVGESVLSATTFYCDIASAGIIVWLGPLLNLK